MGRCLYWTDLSQQGNSARKYEIYTEKNVLVECIIIESRNPDKDFLRFYRDKYGMGYLKKVYAHKIEIPKVNVHNAIFNWVELDNTKKVPISDDMKQMVEDLKCLK